MLVPLCRCLRSLAERRDRAEQEQEEAAPEALESEEPGGEQKVMARCARLGGRRAVRVPASPASPAQGQGQGQSHLALLRPALAGAQGLVPAVLGLPSAAAVQRGSPAGTVRRWRGRGPLQPRVRAWDMGRAGPGGAGRLTQPFFLPTAALPAPQALLARLLVSSGAPGKELLWLGQGQRAGEMVLRPVPGAPGGGRSVSQGACQGLLLLLWHGSPWAKPLAACCKPGQC